VSRKFRPPHDIPVDPGRDVIRATLEQFIDIATDVEFEITVLACDGQKVLTEGLDRSPSMGSASSCPSWAPPGSAATTIRARKDYFRSQFMKQMA
jgi:hypothetical protein